MCAPKENQGEHRKKNSKGKPLKETSAWSSAAFLILPPSITTLNGIQDIHCCDGYCMVDDVVIRLETIEMTRSFKKMIDQVRIGPKKSTSNGIMFGNA